MLKAINKILFLKNLIFSLVMFLISYQFRLIIFYKFDVNVFTDISNPMSGIYYYIISLIGFRLKSILKLFDFNLDINKIRLFLNILNKNKIYMGGSEPDSIDKNLYLKKNHLQVVIALLIIIIIIILHLILILQKMRISQILI